MSDYKAILLDFDGVLSPGKYFSEIYSEKFNIDIETMLPFLEESKDAANIGKADLLDMISQEGILEKWQWKGTAEELLDWWFKSDTDIDQEVVKAMRLAQTNGAEVFLCTDQEKYKGEFIWNELKLSDWMDGKFVSYELGLEKSSPEFFSKVLSALGLTKTPKKLLLIDDSKSKIDSALSAGISAELYTGPETLKNIF